MRAYKKFFIYHKYFWICYLKLCGIDQFFNVCVMEHIWLLFGVVRLVDIHCSLLAMRVCARTQISETAHTHKFAAHRYIVFDHKITIIKLTIKFLGRKTASIQVEDLFLFWFLVFT